MLRTAAKTLVAGDGALSTEFDRPGDTLLVTFGGIAEGMGMPPFEFRRVLADLPAKLVFCRDTSQMWYHGRLEGIGHGIEDLAVAVDKCRESAGTSRLVCVGNSMGGYAALVVGSLCRADLVLAFSPQTFLSRRLRIRYADFRWGRQVWAARRSSSALLAAMDLRQYLVDPGYAVAKILAARGCRLDAIHAKRLKRVPRTSLELRSEKSHNIVKGMRDSGELTALLGVALTPYSIGVRVRGS